MTYMANSSSISSTEMTVLPSARGRTTGLETSLSCTGSSTPGLVVTLGAIEFSPAESVGGSGSVSPMDVLDTGSGAVTVDVSIISCTPPADDVGRGVENTAACDSSCCRKSRTSFSNSKERLHPTQYDGHYQCVLQITHLLFLVRRKPVSTLHSRPKRWQREHLSPAVLSTSEASKLHRSY